MIKSFKDKKTEAIFYGYRHPAFPSEMVARAKTKLQVLHAACDLRDLKVPYSNHLEELERDRKGQWSIRISKQWRICFEWRGNNAYQVEIVDYH